MSKRKSTSRSSGSKKKPTPSQTEINDDSDTDPNVHTCPWGCGYTNVNLASVKAHAMRMHMRTTSKDDESASASEPIDDFRVSEIDELKQKKTRLELERQIKKLEDDIGKSNGGTSDLERRLYDLENRRAQESLFNQFDRRFQMLENEMRGLRSDGNRQPIQSNDSYRNLSQQLFRLEKEIATRDQNDILSQIAHLRERIEDGQRQTRPAPYEVEGSLDRDFIAASSRLGERILIELADIRKELGSSRKEIVTTFKPFGRVLAEKFLKVKADGSEFVEPGDFQLMDRKLSPEQLSRLDERLRARLGEDYGGLSDNDLEREAILEVNKMISEKEGKPEADTTEEEEPEEKEVDLDDISEEAVGQPSERSRSDPSRFCRKG